MGTLSPVEPLDILSMDISRVKRFIVPLESFGLLMTDLTNDDEQITVTGWPKGAVVIGVTRASAYRRAAIALMIHHPEFDQIPIGGDIPEIVPTFHRRKIGVGSAILS